MKLLRSLLAILLAFAMLGVGPAFAQGDGDGGESRSGDTSAVVVNETDGLDLFKAMFQIRRVVGDTVDNQNAAVAYASCSDCETVAISFQIVLASGELNEVSPENYAIAVNEQCESCLTVAHAYQFVIATKDRMEFTEDGYRRLAEVRRALQRLRGQDLDETQLQAAVDALADEVREVLRTELVPADDHGDDDGGDGGDGGDGRGQPSPEPTVSTSSDASADASPSPSESPSSEPTPTGDPSPSPDASPTPTGSGA